MKEDEINYRTLREIQQMEKKSPILTELKSAFYIDISKFVEELKSRLQDESSSQKLTLLNEEIENIQKIAINIYELRERKILLTAITKTRGGSPDIKNMTNTEKKLYESILNLLDTSRNNLFKNESNEKEKIENEEKSFQPKKIDEKPKENNKNPNPIVRVIKDVPEFIGTNEKRYNLRKNDILSLPEDMCEMLDRRGVIKKINN
jgi:DNA replication factor GINS